MTYAIADIHGCFDKYMQMLEKIGFCDNDMLYVVGDVLDRGAEPMKVLHDMSMRANVIPLLGNHEYIAHEMLGQLLYELNEENINKHFGGDLMNFARRVQEWTDIGGDTTMRSFGQLAMDERLALVEYLGEFSLYETLIVNGQKYILTHAGLPAGATPGNLGRYDAWDYVTAEIDYKKTYFPDAFLVTGHLPTYVIDEVWRGRIYRENRHIAIDVGAVFGEALGCVCLDTGEEFYV